MLTITSIFLRCLIVLLASAQFGHGWDNGLARTPPMGWLSWLRFACNIDCDNYPKECINEQLYQDMIDKITEDGYLELGYNTVNIDDCWMEKHRNRTTSRLIPDRFRFPNGIASLAQYAHSKGVMLGIYEDVGTETCGGYPGTRGSKGKDYTYIDAKTFAQWKVDSLKLDGCFQNIDLFNQTYPEYRKALSQQSHKLVYACSWPAYINVSELSNHDYKMIRDNCNYWRNFDDIMDSWQSVLSIITFYGQHGNKFAEFHGPGGWFDPDMLIIGNDGLSYEQSKTQMAFWCIWSAPLFMSNDLRTIDSRFRDILLNRHLIAVNQDPLGIMGHIVMKSRSNNRQVWVKKLSSSTCGVSPYVVLYFNNDTLGVDAIMSYRLSQLVPELKSNTIYDVYDLFANHTRIDSLNSQQNLTLRVKISGSVRVIKLEPQC